MANTYIGTIKGTDDIVYPIGSTLYGFCTTEADEPLKEVTIYNGSWTNNERPSFSTLKPGLTIHVYMQYGNTANAPRLTINGATYGNDDGINIHKNGTYAGYTPATSWTANSMITFTYTGAAWAINTPYSDLNVAVRSAIGYYSENNYNTITAALGYIPANSASSGGEKHTFVKISNNSSDTRYRMEIN